MKISCIIKGFVVHNVLVDIGSAVHIIFARAFRQMQESEDRLQEVVYPLCGFKGKQIAALRKIAMPVNFDYIQNTRTEEITFVIVEP
jgi:flagellar assembly factor FliW